MNPQIIERERLKVEVSGLHSAVGRFKEALSQPNDARNFIRDSSIQRFEFCAELAWKTIKTYLIVAHKTECVSPPTCVRAAFAKDLIEDDPFWIEIYDMRNLVSHTYKEPVAEQIYAALPEVLKRFETLLSALDKDISHLPDTSQ